MMSVRNITNIEFFFFFACPRSLKSGSRIWLDGVHMSHGNAQEAQSLYVRQCIIQKEGLASTMINL